MEKEERHCAIQGCSSMLFITKTSGKALCAPVGRTQYHNILIFIVIIIFFLLLFFLVLLLPTLLKRGCFRTAVWGV